MKQNLSHLDQWREMYGRYGSPPGVPYGAFRIPFRSTSLKIVAAIANELVDWDHVSVSLPNRCPNWEEMAFIKSLFWNDDETVIQFMPRKSEHVNMHPYCLHMWRKAGAEPELPPRICV